MRVQLFAHVTFPTGYGRAARELARSLLAAGVELEIAPLGRPQDPINTLYAYQQSETALAQRFRALALLTPNPDVIVVHTLPLDCHRVLERIKVRQGDGPKLIAFTTWEGFSPPPPEMLDAWCSFDQVWMPNCVSWAGRGDVPWKHEQIFHSFDENISIPTRRRTGPYRFYYVGTWDARKQPSAIIRTFANTFTPAIDYDVELVMHIAGMSRENFAVQLATTGLAREALPKIRLSDEYLSDEQVMQFHVDGDCYVTASRGEAWNLPAFDAMLARTHIIAPVDQGSDEFLMNTSARLYDGQLAPAACDVRAEYAGDALKMIIDTPQGLDSRSLWIEPDLEELGRNMREAYDDRIDKLQVGYDPAARYGRKAVGRLITKALETT